MKRRFSAAHRRYASTEGSRRTSGLWRDAPSGRDRDADESARSAGAPARGAGVAARKSPPRSIARKPRIQGRFPRDRRRQANTFLAAQGKNVGKSIWREGNARHRARDPRQSQVGKCQIVLPVDAVVAKSSRPLPLLRWSVDAVKDDDMIRDIARAPSSLRRGAGARQDAGCGTGPWAASSSSRSIPARSKWPRRLPS